MAPKRPNDPASTPLIRARNKPRFGFPWVAVVLGLGTTIFAGIGVNTVTAEPTAPVQITIEGQNPYNISQETLDAVITEPILAWEPLTIRVTDRALSYDELQGRTDPGADVILTTLIDSDTFDTEKEQRFTGAGIYPAQPNNDENLSDRYAISNAYLDNVGLGHGPLAVASAAQRAADVLDGGRIRSPEFWVAGTATGLLLTVLAFGFSLRRRRRREGIFRRLTAAQRQLAGVVLELEALEVTYLGTDQTKRTAGFTESWTQIRDDSLSLAKTEQAVINAVYDSSTSLSPKTAELVAAFEARAHALVTSADALMGAGSVLGELAGGARVLDRLAAPTLLSARELIARLRAAPQGAISPQHVTALEQALEEFLTAGARKGQSAAVLKTWARAEKKLERTAHSVYNALRHDRRARVRGASRGREDTAALRVSLGLAAGGTKQVRYALDDANAAARALFGPLPGSTETAEVPRAQHRWSTWDLQAPPRAMWITLGIVIGIGALIFGGVTEEKITERPGWDLTGSLPVHSLTVDDPSGTLDEDQLRGYLQDGFSHEVDLTLAVRDAEDYLDTVGSFDPLSGVPDEDLDPSVLVDSLWRLKAEFPELSNAITQELNPNQYLVPVYLFDNGTVTTPTWISSTPATGDHSKLSRGAWEYGSYSLSNFNEPAMATTIESLARGLQRNGIVETDVNSTLLFWLLTVAFALGATTLIQIFIFGGTISMKLGRFGRGGKLLRQLRRKLDALALGLDESRLNTVLVLGTGPAASSTEADQRIFERSLAVAWRTADDLAARPLAQRLNAAYVSEIQALSELVDRLEIRDSDAQRRTRELLATTQSAAAEPARF